MNLQEQAAILTDLAAAHGAADVAGAVQLLITKYNAIVPDTTAADLAKAQADLAAANAQLAKIAPDDKAARDQLAALSWENQMEQARARCDFVEYARLQNQGHAD